MRQHYCSLSLSICIYPQTLSPFLALSLTHKHTEPYEATMDNYHDRAEEEEEASAEDTTRRREAR